MRNLILFLLFCGSLTAQTSTFAIYDTSYVNVTNGIYLFQDTNATVVTARFLIVNTDSVHHDVTAGRLVITHPVNSTDSFAWNSINYPSTADSSLQTMSMNPGDTGIFEGYYMSNWNAGSATINYCFWETLDMDNYSCVTVTFDNNLILGYDGPVVPEFTCGPNPATTHLGIGWSHCTFDRIEMYSADGRLVSSVNSDLGLSGYEWDITEFTAGIYYIYCSDSQTGFSTNFTFLHIAEE